MRRLQICLSLILVTACFGQLGNVNLNPLPGMQFINRTHRLSRGLVAYYPFNERSGPTIFDLLGNGNTGTLGGTAPSWTSGKFGSAVYLPGDDEYINIPNTPALPGDLSICFLFAPDSTTTLGYLSDFSGDNEFACIKGYQIGFYNVFGLAYPTGTATDSQIPMSGAGILDFIVWTKQGTTLKGYVNGKEECSVTITGGDFTPSAGWILGGRAPFDSNVAGRFELAMLYNRALSAGEIAEFYKEKDSWMFKRGDIELMAKSVAAPPSVVPTLYYYSFVPIPLAIIAFCFILGRKNDSPDNRT